jgi:hypothetical protein
MWRVYRRIRFAIRKVLRFVRENIRRFALILQLMLFSIAATVTISMPLGTLVYGKIPAIYLVFAFLIGSVWFWLWLRRQERLDRPADDEIIDQIDEEARKVYQLVRGNMRKWRSYGILDVSVDQSSVYVDLEGGTYVLNYEYGRRSITVYGPYTGDYLDISQRMGLEARLRLVRAYDRARAIQREKAARAKRTQLTKWRRIKRRK